VSLETLSVAAPDANDGKSAVDCFEHQRVSPGKGSCSNFSRQAVSKGRAFVAVTGEQGQGTAWGTHVSDAEYNEAASGG
jgi:hypothetical protein